MILVTKMEQSQKGGKRQNHMLKMGAKVKGSYGQWKELSL